MTRPAGVGLWGILSLCCLLLPVGVHAVTPDEIYAVDVPVSGQGRQDRQAAFKVGLERVLVRATGQRVALKQPGLTRAIAHARAYVQRYDYVEPPVEAAVSRDDPEALPTMSGGPESREGPRPEAAETPPADTPPVETLHIVFDDEAIERLLHEQGLPVWGTLRPTLLVLFAIDDGGQRRVLAAEDETTDDLPGVVSEVGRRRALPVILPLLDIEDQQVMRFSDVWGDFAGPLRQVAGRYRAGALLVGRAYREELPGQPGQWRMRWSLYGDDETVDHWQARGETLATGLGEALDEAVDRLGRWNARALTAQTRTQTLVRVHDVRAIGDFARVMSYLASIEIVDDVHLVSVSGELVECRLAFKGGRDYLRKIIAYGDTLAAARDAGAGPRARDADEALNLRLLP